MNNYVLLLIVWTKEVFCDQKQARSRYSVSIRQLTSNSWKRRSKNDLVCLGNSFPWIYHLSPFPFHFLDEKRKNDEIVWVFEVLSARCLYCVLANFFKRILPSQIGKQEVKVPRECLAGCLFICHIQQQFLHLLRKRKPGIPKSLKQLADKIRNSPEIRLGAGQKQWHTNRGIEH